MLGNPAFAAMLAARPSAAATLPAIGSPVHALDAAAPGTLFSDTAGTAAAGAGQGVARANDAGGAARWFQQAAVDQRPTLVAAAAAGRPGLRFTGTQWMALRDSTAGVAALGELFRTRTFTLAAVWRRASSGAYAGLFAAGAAGNTENDFGPWADQLQVELQPGGPAAVWRYAGDGEVAAAAPGSLGYADGALTKLVARCSQAAGLEAAQRSSAGSAVASGLVPAAADQRTWQHALLGAFPDFHATALPTFRFAGDIHELRFWGARADDAQFAQAQAYLDSKWGT